MTGETVHRGSYWQKEFQKKSRMPWWEVLEISFASNACDCGHRYNRELRTRVLEALTLPDENE